MFDFAVVLRAGARLIGRCGLKLSDAEQTEATLWYVLARNAWQRGYATEAAQAVLAFGFQELRLHRVFVEVDPRNGASLRVAEKLGGRGPLQKAGGPTRMRELAEPVVEQLAEAA
jgi:RimJ/RimL family protein N-acetyltransferase